MELPVLDDAGKDDAGARRKALADRLAPAIAGEVRIDAHHRGLYSTDASIYQVEPLAVVIPRKTDDLQRTIQVCADLELGVLGRGAGTSLAGQTVAEAVVVDCSVHLNQVEALETGSEPTPYAVAQPGVVLDQLNARAQQEGLRFGPDVSTSTHATIGGMIMNCSAGTYSLREGMTDEHVLALDVVLADGRRLRLEEGASERDEEIRKLTEAVAETVLPLADEIESRFPQVRRNVGGYALDDILAQLRQSTPGTFDRVNLARLICGSEGTLAFLERAKLRLEKVPAERVLALVLYDSVDDAVCGVVPALATMPAAVELIDSTIIDAAAAQEVYADDVSLLARSDGSLARAAIYVEWFLQEGDDATERFDALSRELPGASILRVADSEMAQRLWTIRKVGLGLMSKAEGTCIPMPGVEDCAVAPERLVDFRRELDGIFARHGRTAVFYAHASVGLLHVRPRIDVAKLGDLEDFEQIQREAMELVRKYGGSISGEHGDGRIRAELVHDFYGPKLVEGFQRIKAIFDPDGRLNPGDKVEARPAMTSLRRSFAGEDTLAGQWETYYHFDEEGSFARAASACDGNGLCRRHSVGAMCPSYRATRAERDATRGRANALAALVRGETELGDAELEETMALCLSCKACRHECPSNVDMSRLKAEMLAQKWKRASRVPLRETVLSRAFHKVNRIGSHWRFIANAMGGWGPSRRLLAQLLGVSKTRSLPRFERMLESQVGSQGGESNSDRPAVLLFPDCFTNCNEPSNGLAAIEVLEAFGYRVIVPPKKGGRSPFCCGRAAMSGGFLATARSLIEQTAPRLIELIERESIVGIVAVEPSCASAFGEDWLDLRSDVPKSDLQRIASMTDVLEGFLLSQWDKLPRRPSFTAVDGPIQVHQHCHLKYTGARLGDLLERCLEQKVQMLDSGCCGMAGSFGYREEQYELSLAVAEDSLGRFLRNGSSTLVAPGTSCRHQVHDVFGQVALHPAEFLRRCLVSEVRS